LDGVDGALVARELDCVHLRATTLGFGFVTHIFVLLFCFLLSCPHYRHKSEKVKSFFTFPNLFSQPPYH
jgi:hypothetical protein